MFTIKELKNKYVLLTLIFIVSLFVHLIGLNQMGRTWDEQFKIDMGSMSWSNLGAGDFSKDSWYFFIEHPMVAKYIYGLFTGPNFIRVDNGFGGYANLTSYEISEIEMGNYILTGIGKKLYMVSYDLTMPRFASAVFNSLGVTLVVAIALLFLSELWAIMAGVFILLSPRFVAMGQLVTFESITIFFFGALIIVFYKLLENPKKVNLYVLTGVLGGLLFWTRYNNFYVFIFLGGWFLLHYLLKKDKKIINPKLILIPTIAFFLGILIWPLMWHEFPKYLIESFSTLGDRGVTYSVYYINRVITTTPIPVLVGLILGILFTLKEKKYWPIVFVWLFASVLVIHTFAGVAGGGTRYMFVIYPAIGILAAYGFSKILNKKYVYALIPLILFMLYDMFSYYPYYLDYYNSFIGAKKASNSTHYEFSWWGEGQREVGMYINSTVPTGASVGLIVVPQYVFPSLRRDIKNLGYVDAKTEAEYLVVSKHSLNGLPKEFFEKHEIIYSADVRNQPLVYLFKKK